MGSIELGRPPDGDSCSEEDENFVLDRAERDHQADSVDSNWIALAFRPFCARAHKQMRGLRAADMHGGGGLSLTVVVTPPLVIKLTRDIVDTYQTCNPSFGYSVSFNPKRYLTNPSAGVSNGGQDNANSDLILFVNGVLVNGADNRRYIVKDMLGQGTFGQVCKCWTDDSNGYVAVKVIKNQPAYFQQALVEISICHMLNHHDPTDGHNIVRILDHFVFAGHLCLVFELLSANLFELLKLNQFKGLSMMLVRRFTKQMLDALSVLRDASVIHCDLKPENILLQQSLESAEIKLIDFGSACTEHRTVYSYIQSRFYRSPEVLLGHQYTTAIDMWSLGCVAAELFLGLPLFPGASEYDLFQRMIEILCFQPPDSVLRQAKNTSKFFKLITSAPVAGHMTDGQCSAYQFLSEAEFEAREQRKPQLGRRYFVHKKLEDMIVNYPLRRRMSEEEIEEETQARVAFIDFLKGLLHFDPLKRWTPTQAVHHPFLTEGVFRSPFRPIPETPRTPVGQGMAMDHNPVTGHWFGAGLSPQVNVLGMGGYSNSHYVPPYSYASSYSSIGSHGSYGDGTGLGSSLGSYGEVTGMYFSYPSTPVSGLNGHNQGGSAAAALGVSPDTYRRMQISTVPTQLGMSPSGGFRPMSLGASPSHNFPPSPGSNFHGSPGSSFHPSPIAYAASPGSNYHGSPAAHFLASPSSPSHSSPSRYGPTSPARVGGSALGKIAHFNNHNNMNKRRPWERLPIPTSSHPDLMAAHRQRLHQQNAVGNDRTMRGAGSPGVPNMGRHRNGSVVTHLPPASTSYPTGTLGALLNSPDNVSDAGEDVSPPPDPRDWDPSYSDELLLGGDLFEGPSSGVTAMDLSEVSSGVSRLGTGGYTGPGEGVLVGHQHGPSTLSGSQCRLTGAGQGQPATSCSWEGSAASLPNPVHGQQQQLPYVRNSPKHGPYTHATQTSPSRLGPHPTQLSQVSHQYRSQHQAHHLSSQHSPDSSSPIIGAARGQAVVECGISSGGLLPPVQRDPRASYHGPRMTGNSSLGGVAGLAGVGPDNCGPLATGFHMFAVPFVPNVEQLTHHVTTEPNLTPWAQPGYNLPYSQNVQQDVFALGRRPGLPLMTGRPPPPTAPTKNYGSKRSG